MGIFTLPLSFKLWKQSLNSDDQQFHKYQQNKQPPIFTSNHWIQKKTTIYDVGIPCPDLGQAQNCEGLNQ